MAGSVCTCNHPCVCTCVHAWNSRWMCVHVRICIWVDVCGYAYVCAQCMPAYVATVTIPVEHNAKKFLQLCSTGTGSQRDSQSMAPGSEQLRLLWSQSCFAQAFGQIMSGDPFQPVLCYESVWECVLTYVYAFVWHWHHSSCLRHVLLPRNDTVYLRREVLIIFFFQ